jgi:hypothetical protein
MQDLQKLEEYADRLDVAQKVGFMAFISNSNYEINERYRKTWDEREDAELLTWRGIQSRARTYYEHYRAILEGDVQNVHFGRKEKEVARTREVLETGAYRGLERRREGVGPQDVDYPTPGQDTDE